MNLFFIYIYFIHQELLAKHEILKNQYDNLNEKWKPVDLGDDNNDQTKGIYWRNLYFEMKVIMMFRWLVLALLIIFFLSKSTGKIFQVFQSDATIESATNR